MIFRRFPNLQNKEDFSAFHQENVLICAESSEISYSEHTAPLSIKTCFKGREIYETKRVPVAVEQGKCLVINNQQPYASYILEHEPVESFCIFFRDNLDWEVLANFVENHEKLLENYPINQQTPFFQNLRPANSRLFPVLENLYREIKNGNGSQLWLDERTDVLMEILLVEQHHNLREIEKLPLIRQTTRIEIYKRLNLAKDYIESCYDEPLNLKKIAQIACLSPHHFLRLFKSAFHQTPHQYLTEIRLQKALSLVKQNNSSITEICFEVGFENLSSFSRLFKNRFNFSPNEFRKNIQ